MGSIADELHPYAAHGPWLQVGITLYMIKFQLAIFPLSKYVICFHKLPVNTSYNRAFIVDRSLSGIMTSKLIICESYSDFPNDKYL